MKKSVLVLVLPLLSYAQMTITAAERASAEITPDVLRGYLGFEEQNKNPGVIKEHFNAIVAEVKKFDPRGEICRGGGYHLSPRYSYKDQKQEFLGYGGVLSFSCEYTAIEQVNALGKALDRITAAGVRRAQGALSWGVSAQKSEEAEQELRLAVLKKAQLRAERFSRETGLACGPEKINFSPYSRPVPVSARAMAVQSVPTESPIQADEEVSVEASVDYSCVKRVP